MKLPPHEFSFVKATAPLYAQIRASQFEFVHIVFQYGSNLFQAVCIF